MLRHREKKRRQIIFKCRKTNSGLFSLNNGISGRKNKNKLLCADLVSLFSQSFVVCCCVLSKKDLFQFLISRQSCADASFSLYRNIFKHENAIKVTRDEIQAKIRARSLLSLVCVHVLIFVISARRRSSTRKKNNGNLKKLKIEPRELNLCLLGEPSCCREFIERLRSLRRVLKWNRKENN